MKAITNSKSIKDCATKTVEATRARTSKCLSHTFAKRRTKHHGHGSISIPRCSRLERLRAANAYVHEPKILVGPYERSRLSCVTTIRGLAIRINAGQGDGYYLDKYSKTVRGEDDVSLAQHKAAQLELDQMTHRTNHILSMTYANMDNKKENLSSFVNQLKVTINYWTSRWITHYHPFFSIHPSHVKFIMSNRNGNRHSKFSQGRGPEEQNCGDYGAKQAERLIHWMQEMDKTNPDLRLVDQVLSKEEGVGNATLNNIIDAYLLPCATNMSHKRRDGIETADKSENLNVESILKQGQGVKETVMRGNTDSANNGDMAVTNENEGKQVDDFVQLSSITGAHNVNPSSWIPAIYDASRVIDIMNDIHKDSSTSLKPDTNSNNAILHTLAKLCLIIANTSNNTSDIDWKHFAPPSDRQEASESLPSTCEFNSIQDVVSKMVNLVEVMEAESLQGGDESSAPDTLTYNHIITSIARTLDADACDRVEWYLKRMERKEDLAMGVVPNDDNDTDLPPATAFADTTTYNLVLHTISSSMNNQNPDEAKNMLAAKKANAILDRMERRYEQSKREDARPLTVTYSTVLNTWAKSGQAENAEELLNRFISLSRNAESEYVVPNKICFNIVVAAWANRGGRQAAENALRILEYMEQLATSGDFQDIYPDTITYSSVIKAFARSGREDAGDRALDLLEHSIKLYDGGRKELQPDSMTFNTVMGALSRQSQLEWQNKRQKSSNISQSRAEKLLELMKQMHAGGSTTVRPCAISHNILIDLYAKKGATDLIEESIKEMSEAYEKGDVKMKPQKFTYNSYIYALANSREQNGVSRALNVLYEMEGRSDTKSLASEVPADIYGYINIINALAKKAKFDSTSPAAIESLLTSMEQRYLNGESDVKPNPTCYNCLIDAYSKVPAKDSLERAQKVISRMLTMSDKLKAPELRPDKISYSTIIATISRGNYRDGPEQAEAILKAMKEASLEPNTYTYNGLLHCWSASGRKNAAEEAEKILTMMQEHSELGNLNVAPNAVTFSIVINCWARLRDKNSGERAERILDLMQKIDDAANYENRKINRHTYGTVLNAWSKSIGHPDAVQRALGVLRKMEERYENGDVHVSPNEPCYNAVINTIAKSSAQDKTILAESVLNRMLESYENGNTHAKPGIRTFSTILNACAYTKEEDKERAFRVARGALKEALCEKYGDPNNVVFASFLAACRNLMKPGLNREKLVCSVFDESRRRGMVDTHTIVNLRRLAPPHILKELLQGTTLMKGDVHLDDIPDEWRSNVKAYHP